MKALLPSKAKTQSKIVLLENDQLITDLKCVAETLNDYFCDVAASNGAQMSLDEFKKHPSVKRFAEHIGPAGNFDFQLIEVEYVKGILQGEQWDVTTYCSLLRITTPAIAQTLTYYSLINCTL